MTYKKKDYYMINIASTIAYIGAAASWSGIPYFLVTITGSVNYFAFLIIISQVIGFITPLISQYIVDKFNRKYISIASSLFAIISLIFLMFTDFKTHEIIFVMIISFLWVALYLGEPSRSTWQGNIIKSLHEHCEEGMAKFTMINMIGKGIGFSLGPIIFEYLRYKGFLVEILGYATEIILLLFVAYKKIDALAIKTVSSFRFIVKNLNFISIIALGNIFSWPLLYIGQSLLSNNFSSSALVISAFWFSRTIGAICSHFIIGRGVLRWFNHLKVYTYLSYAIFLIFIIIFTTTEPYIIILMGLLFSLINPILNLIIRKDIFMYYEDGVRGRLIAVSNSISALFNIVILYFLKALNLNFSLDIVIILVSFNVIILFRNYLVKKHTINLNAT